LGRALHFRIMMGFSLCFSFPLGTLWFGYISRVTAWRAFKKCLAIPNKY